MAGAVTLGLDVSHFQGAPNWAQVKASGREFVVLKATDGTGYLDPTFATNRAGAHAAGLVVGIYHFVEGGTTAAETAWFLSRILPVQAGEFLVLDFEVAYPGDHVVWCRAWLDAVTAQSGVCPLIYMNQAEMKGHDWTPVAAQYGLWLARYDGSTAAPTVSWWASAAMKQYSDVGTVLGVAGAVDVDVFYGTTQQLLAYGAGGTQGVDMTPDEHLALMQVRDYLGANGGQNSKTVDTVGFKVTDLHTALPQLLAGTAPVVDAQALAAALLADPAGVDRLGAAIAAHLKLTSG